VSAHVVFADAEPSGLGTMLGGLLEQNLERDPTRKRLLTPTLVSIEAPDAEVAVTLRILPGRVLVADGARPGAHLVIAADSARLLALTDAPLRFGLPDPLQAQGRAVLADVLARRVRIRGMISHPRRLARLTMLLSVR
jgi:hypothetical protein